MGTLAVVEPQDETLRALYRYELESPTSLIRMMVQESNCFIVVERGRALERMAQERELAASGQLAGGSNVGGGQMQAADFYLTPDVLFSEGDAGGIGGAVGGLLGRGAGAIAGGLKFKEAETSLLVTNTRSGVQVASADGSARETDFGGGALGFLGGGGAALGGYTNTNEGKVIAASFLDNYNEIVETVRNDPNLPPLSPEEVRARMTGETPAGGGFSAGDVVVTKIDNVDILAEPAAGAAVVTKVGRSDPMVFLGGEENGYIQVQSSQGPGWVLKVLVTGQ
ncbi:MAG TPA: CsgG/HfaB family protein [Longimicrobiales bacterium]|nr:CsgG/HfaB family protein [Longimicrobiales bacterium]